MMSTYKGHKDFSERTVKSTGISPVRAYDSGKKPRVAPERSDLSSRWQKMIPTLRDKGKPSFKFAIFLWIMPRSPKRNKKQSNYMHLLQNIVFFNLLCTIPINIIRGYAVMRPLTEHSLK